MPRTFATAAADETQALPALTRYHSVPTLSAVGLPDCHLLPRRPAPRPTRADAPTSRYRRDSSLCCRDIRAAGLTRSRRPAPPVSRAKCFVVSAASTATGG